MKTSVVGFFFVASLFIAGAALAQNNSSETIVAPGCGDANVKFDVRSEKSQHPAAHQEDGKALVYFVEDDSFFESRPRPTTRVGLDGAWVGANQANSYFYFSVDPGEHHLCASWQGFIGVGMGRQSAAAHFTAEAGKIYYFRVQNTWLREHGTAKIELSPLDSDEGQLLASKFAFSTSHPK
jgi:Protein of unknown function (DUF2846)